MKKTMLLAAVGLTGLLASCNGDLAIDSGYYGGYSSSSNARLNSLTNYTTSYTYNGNYVICKNYNTDVNFTLSWTGYLSAVGFQVKGYNTGSYVNTDTYSVNSGSGSAPVTLTIGAGMAPLKVGAQRSIKAQSIVVNPTNLGYTYIRAQGIDGNGNATNIVQTSYSIPVMNCG